MNAAVTYFNPTKSQLIYQFHVQNAKVLADIPEEELNTTIETIRKIYQKMDAFNRYKGDEQFV